MATTENPILPQLPDDVIHQIFRLLPTKSAIRTRCVSKQFEDLWSIELDEGDALDMDDDTLDRHTEFIHFWETSLDSRKTDKHVDKFRLRMMRYSLEDDNTIYKFLLFAFQRNVMMLDLSLRSKPGLAFYNLHSGFLEAENNHMTSLNLEYVRLNIGNLGSLKLPFLRSMSFKSVILYSEELTNSRYYYHPSSRPKDALTWLVSSCPIIENLSLNFNETTDDEIFCLSLESLLGSKCLTTLHLENMKIRNSDPGDSSTNSRSVDCSHLPLKSMSLKAVDLKSCASFSELISRCSKSIECLSFSSCSFPRDIQFSSSSLKTLEVIDCKGQQLNVLEAPNLESFTCLISESEHLPRLGSEIGQLSRTALHGCKNLKHVNIFSEHLEQITLGGCKDCVEVTMDTPNLRYFHFSGNLKSTISMEAPNIFDASITLLCGNSNPPWRHFPTVGDFLKNFGHSKRILLNIDYDEVDFLFPESFRESLSCPLLPSLRFLVVYRKEKLKERDSDLRNSMLWMAPSAKLEIKSK